MRRQHVLSLGALALVPPLALAGAGYVQARRALPVVRGDIRVTGLHDRVEIIRDGVGVPHIYADSLEDVFFAQGYVTAQDRLWQLEFNRRLAWGRLSELVGLFGLDVDRLFRLLGLGRAALVEEAVLGGEARSLLAAYCAGINACAARPGTVLPIEFTLLRTGFSAWQLVDCLAWGKMMAWQLGANAGAELLRAALVARLGPREAADLMPSVPPGHLPEIAPEVDYTGLGASIRRLLAKVVSLVTPPGGDLGSNNWVVSGSRAAEGRPLLAHDPHLGVQVPPVWYEVHLVGGGLEVAGFSLPGVPGVVVGHNRHIAWGVTNAGVDVQDFYVERRHPDDPNLFLFRGAWEPATVVVEEIRVRGRRRPVVLTIPHTRHGPVLNADAPNEAPLALRWTALQPSCLAASGLRLNLAANWPEFREALRGFDEPAQNFVYADEEGNIGYQMAGRVPVRARGDGLLPVPGWTGEYEWAGQVPYDELPSALNPQEGYLATANDRVVDDAYAYLLGHEWAPRYRVERIKRRLAGRSDWTVGAMANLQQDVRSRFAEWLVPRLLSAVESGLAVGGGEQARRLPAILRVLAQWDCEVRADSPAAAIVNVFWVQLLDHLFKEKLGRGLAASYFSAVRSHLPAVCDLWDDPRPYWWGEGGGSAAAARDEVVLRALVTATDRLARRFGEDPEAWRWGRIHTLAFKHPLATLPPLSWLFNRGPFPRGGDNTTVAVSGYSYAAPYREGHHPSLRMVLDTGDWDRSLGSLPLGQSGQPLSPHYDDQLPGWLAGEYHAMPFTRETVTRESAARLILHPPELGRTER